MPYRSFDRSRLSLLPLSEREHDMRYESVKQLQPMVCSEPALEDVALRMRLAKERGASVVLMFGAHVLKSGMQRYLIDWMERGAITALATNGASAIHDYEMARIGATTESVARYVKEGQFGLWSETGEINDIITDSIDDSGRAIRGFGEAIGQSIEESSLRKFPNKGVSIFAAAYRLGLPITVHSSIGYDIVHEHPNCDGGAHGATSYLDFLRFAAELEKLEGGVVMNFGSAIMGPEVYLKALSMVRNVAKQDGREVKNFTTLVCDLYELPKEFHQEAPKDSPAYYFRPWKTMLVRTVADGGTSFYVCGDHSSTIPQLWTETTQCTSKAE